MSAHRGSSGLEREILSFLGRRKSAPTTTAIVGNLTKPGSHRSASDVEAALQRLVDSGAVVCTNGLWVRRDSLMVDNRKPKGPRKLDPKSAEARTLPLEFYK